MKQLLIGAALVGGAALLGRRGGKLGGVVPFQHPLIALAEKYRSYARASEVNTQDPLHTDNGCKEEKEWIQLTENLRYRLDAKITEEEKKLGPDAPDEKWGTVLWALNLMGQGDDDLKLGRENWKFHCGPGSRGEGWDA